MKKKYILLALIVTIGALFVRHFFKSQIEPLVDRSVSIETQQTKQTNHAPVAPESIKNNPVRLAPNATNGSQPTPESDPAAWLEKRRKQMEAETQRGLNDWRTPIQFYGMVVDEKTNSIADAQVEFVCNDLSVEGTSRYHTTSDSKGLFSLTGITGKAMTVKVNKEGYYAYQRFGASFNYAGENQNFVPNAANPVVFHLKKKGQVEALRIHSVLLEVPQNDQPLGFDLLRSKFNPAGPLVFNLLMGVPERQQADLRLRLTVNGGGIQMTKGEFSFLAPEDGYESYVEIEASKDSSRNQSDRTMECYYFFGEPRVYGRLRFEVSTFRRTPTGGKSGLPLTYWINPGGSRNLESDPAQYIQPVPAYYLRPETPLIDDLTPR